MGEAKRWAARPCYRGLQRCWEEAMSVSVTSTRWEGFNVHSCAYPFIRCIQPRVTEGCWKIKRVTGSELQTEKMLRPASILASQAFDVSQ